MAFTPNLVVGIVITLVGSLLLLDRLGLAPFRVVFDLWPLLVTIFGLSIVVQALRGGSAREGGTATQRPIVGPGLVLFLVVVSFLGWRASERRAAVGDASGSEVNLSLVGIFSQDSRASASSSFESANMLSLMGATRLDLRQAKLAQGREVTVDVVGVMGGVEILVPRHWTVDVRAVAIMGGVRDQRQARGAGAAAPNPDLPPGEPERAQKLVVKGMVVMGGLVIKS